MDVQVIWNDLVTKWKQLDSTIKKSTGSAASPPIQWPYFEKLSFLQEYVSHRTGISTFRNPLSTPPGPSPSEEQFHSEATTTPPARFIQPSVGSNVTWY